MRVYAVILAAGSGVRLGADTPKQLLKLAGKPVLQHTIEALGSVDAVDEIIIVTRQDLVDTARDIATNSSTSKVGRVLIGGETRNHSTLAALDAIEDDDALILLHDAVRPFIEASIVEACIEALGENDAVDVAIPSADTIIEVENGFIEDIPERGRLRRGQTPQGFRVGTLRRAYQHAKEDSSFEATDDCGVIVRYLPEVKIKVVDGAETNIKITHPIDAYLADKLFQLRSLDIDVELSDGDLVGKHMVVVGGSYGIGAAIAERAKELGATCDVLSRSTTKTHVEDVASLRSAFEAIHADRGHIDYIVNCAGLLRIKALSDQSDDEIDELVRINYVGALNVARVGYPFLRESRGQLLLFTSSSFTRGRKNYAVYSSSKAAVVNLTQALAEEWADAEVQVNCINPERTLTPMRVQNFGNEPPNTLLDASIVAERSIATLLSGSSGHVVDVRSGSE